MKTYGYIDREINEKSNTLKASRLLLGVVITFLMWATFKVALFNGQTVIFERPICAAVLFTAVMAMIAIVAGWNLFEWPSRKDGLSLWVFLLPASFALSMLTAASQHLAINMLLIMLMYSIFFTASSILTQDGVINRILNVAIMIIAYIVVFFGLLHWLGNGEAVTTLIKWLGVPTNLSGAYMDAVLGDGSGARLASVFQYANTYAGFLMAFLLAALFSMSKSPTCWGKSVHAFMIVPIILSIFLTLSRGGLLLLPVFFIVVLIFLKPHRQLLWLMHLVVSVGTAILILKPVAEIGLRMQGKFVAWDSFTGWAYILVGSFLSAAISVTLERWVSPWLSQTTKALSHKCWGSCLIPVGGTILIGVILFIFMSTNAKNVLPSHIITRLEMINFQQNSVLERITFYKDSMKLIADYPFIGSGGGAWHALYEKYQNNPYTSRQAHNFYMQYLTETGVLGFSILMVFLIYIYWGYIRSYRKANEKQRDGYFLYFIVATSILLHSTMDFNMSFVYIGVLVFVCLGGMTASMESKPFKKFKPNMFRPVIVSILGIVGIGLFTTANLLVQAANSFANAQKALHETRSLYQTMNHFRKAKVIYPTHPEYASWEASVYLSVYQQTKDELQLTEAEQVLNKAIAANPYNKEVIKQLIAIYSIKGMDEQVYTLYSKHAANFPWDMDFYERYMDSMIHVAYTSTATASNKKKHYEDEVLAAFEHVKAGVEHIKLLPKGQMQGKPFFVTSRMAMNAGRVYFMRDDPATAVNVMKPYLQADLSNPNHRELARWYVAATIKLGRVDQSWYDKLIAVDAAEKAQIKSIAATRAAKPKS